MATTDMQRLIVSLEARTKQFENAMNKVNRDLDRKTKDIGKKFDDLNKRMELTGPRLGLGGAVGGLGLAVLAREVKQYADTWTVAGNKIAAAGEIAGRTGRSLEGIADIANRTRSGIEETTDLYAKLLRSTATVAKSEEEVARATEIVNKAFKAGGAAASEQAAGILQLSQALGSGLLQGDELRSLRENAPLVAKAIADEFGTTIAGLKQLGADGKLTTDRVFKAILNAQPQIEAAFGRTNETIQDGLTKVNNALTQYIGQTDSTLSATARVTQGLSALADNFGAVADVTLKLAAIIAGALVGRAIAGMVRSLGLGTVALVRFAGAMRQASTIGAAVTAIGGLSAVAGPVGIAIGTVLTGALIAFGTESGHASDSAAAYAKALREVEQAAEDSGKAAEDAGKKYVEAEKNRLGGRVVIGEKQIEETRAAVNKLFEDIIANAPRRIISKEQLKQLEDLRKGLADGSMTAEQVEDALFALANSNPKFQKLADQFKPLLDELKNAIGATKTLKKELEDVAGSKVGDPRAGGFSFLAEREKAQKFLDERKSKAATENLDKEINARTKQILDAAAAVGVSITEAAAKIQAASEIQIESQTTAAFDLLKKFEGFRSQPYWDVNAYRAGYGSDTVTLEDGSVQKVVQGISVSVTDANRDLVRRIGEFQAGIKRDIGADTFNAMTEEQQAALTSIAYNYGSLPERIVEAIKTGNIETVYNAIKGLGSDNAGVNRDRRNTEAQLYISEAPRGIKQGIDSREDFAARLEEQRQYIAALQAETGIRAALNPLVNDYGLAMSTLEAAQQLLTDAQKEGTAAGQELSDVQQLLYGDLSGLSPVAREQALAMRELAIKTGEASAESEKLAEKTDNLKSAAEGWNSLAKDVLGGFIQDLKDGKSATEALGNALSKVADKLLDIALNSLFSSKGAFGGFGGFLASIFGFRDGGEVGRDGRVIKLAGGGRVRGPGGPRGDKIPAMLSDGEHVTNAAMSKKYGPLLDAINADKVGRFANGSSPLYNVRGPQPVTGGGEMRITVGVSADNNGNLLPFVESVSQGNIRKAAPALVQTSVQQSQKATRANMPGFLAETQMRTM